MITTTCLIGETVSPDLAPEAPAPGGAMPEAATSDTAASAPPTTKTARPNRSRKRKRAIAIPPCRSCCARLVEALAAATLRTRPGQRCFGDVTFLAQSGAPSVLSGRELARCEIAQSVLCLSDALDVSLGPGEPAAH